MQRRALLLCVGFVVTTTVLACHQTVNDIPEGDPIPDTEILSCGDNLIDSAAPAGSFSATLVLDGDRTLLEGSVLWQASCPDPSAGEETQFSMDGITLYRDDAGYPGELLGSTPFDLEGIVTCPNQSKMQDFEPTEVVDLSAICAEYLQNPTGSSLDFQVEITGRAITCSNETHDLLFRRTVSIDCEPG